MDKNDSNYQLIDDRPATHRRQPVRWQRFAWIGVIAFALLVGGLFGSVLLRNQPAEAMPALPALMAASSSAQRVQLGDVSLFDDQQALADLYSQVGASVVNIQVTSRGAQGFSPFGMPGDEDGLLRSQGSGFIFDDQGHIVTNNHVVEDAESVLVIFSNGMWAKADVVASDPQADLGVLKVAPPEGMNWRPLPLADPTSMRVGHTVIAIGNPFGLNGTLTTGVVSALGRGVPMGEFGEAQYTLPDVIQTDAAINPGNSGGPLINLNGEVVGVNFAIRSQERANAGVGFAIPVSIVQRVVPALIADGKYDYAYLGLSGSSIGPSLAEALDLPANRLGVYVATVLPDGPAAAAGLQGGAELVETADGGEVRRGGDIIAAIDGIPVQRFEDLVSFLVTQATPGQTVSLSVLRNDEALEVPVTLGARPAATATAAQSEGPAKNVNARQAMAIAMEAVSEGDLLSDAVVSRSVTPEERDGADVWVVELATDTQTATVVVDAASGEVVALAVE